jgi:hypothetical protein
MILKCYLNEGADVPLVAGNGLLQVYWPKLFTGAFHPVVIYPSDY